jgi:excisionase family DNA binding protein
MGGTVTDTKLLYSVTEAASVLSLGRTKVYELVRTGVIRSVRIDGSRRIKADDLRAYVARLGEAA